MLQDKDMASDALEMTKVHAGELTKAASECSNKQLKQSFIQMRNQMEQNQEQISQIATQKGWYMPAAPADQQEITRVKTFLQQGTAPQQQTNMGQSKTTV
ncbi:spore coat protein [Metallumcola ferriviriculae]|uniref:Spore coat protein n=1 Tax=Metallumcola ferriviriculae TaxID=3039180 RepID=A0AAU0UQS1_9FIRM|nr:spore coat protein [Desulfitibacteraceae bacterium MK1]